MAKTAVPELTPTHDEIAAQAYEIYLREGCVPGRDLDHWLQAEQEIRARNGGNNGEIHTLASATTVAPQATPIAPTRATTARRSTKR